MDAATESSRPRALSAFLAGLQGGMIGVLCMLAWLGVSATWQQRSFWTAENLMASVFYGARAIRSGFAGETLSGLAMYVVLYSLLGALFAVLCSRSPAAHADVSALAGVRARLVLPVVSPALEERHAAGGAAARRGGDGVRAPDLRGGVGAISGALEHGRTEAPPRWRQS